MNKQRFRARILNNPAPVHFQGSFSCKVNKCAPQSLHLYKPIVYSRHGGDAEQFGPLDDWRSLEIYFDTRHEEELTSICTSTWVFSVCSSSTSTVNRLLMTCFTAWHFGLVGYFSLCFYADVWMYTSLRLSVHACLCACHPSAKPRCYFLQLSGEYSPGAKVFGPWRGSQAQIVMWLYWTYISVLCISGHIAVKYLHYSRHRRGEFTKCPQSKNNKEQSISLSLPFYEMTRGRRWFYCLDVGSPELSASFPESFSVAPSSEVHFNIAPQWKTIKDRIREACYSANNKKRKGTFLLLQKFLCRGGEKKINNQQLNSSVCVSCVSLFRVFVFLAASFCLLSSHCGLSDQKVMLTVAYFLLSYIFYEQPQPHVSLLYSWALGSLTISIDLQSYKSWRCATKVFFSFSSCNFSFTSISFCRSDLDQHIEWRKK